jgi:hypothetical protein
MSDGGFSNQDIVVLDDAGPGLQSGDIRWHGILFGSNPGRILLLHSRICLRRLLRHLLGARQLRTVPPVAQGQYQRHGKGPLLQLEIIQSLLVRQHHSSGQSLATLAPAEPVADFRHHHVLVVASPFPMFSGDQ